MATDCSHAERVTALLIGSALGDWRLAESAPRELEQPQKKQVKR